MLKKTAFYFIFILCISCTQNLKEQNPKLEGFNFPVVVGNSADISQPMKNKRVTSYNSTILDVPHRKSDTIRITQNNNFHYSEGRIESKPFDKNQIELIVDTSQFFTHQVYFLPLPPTLEKESTIRKPSFYNHHPVFLLNNAKDSIAPLLIDGCLFMVQEALDSVGTWRPLTFIEDAFCGNSLWSGPMLNKKNLILSKATIYEGNTPTKFRMRLKLDSTIIFSNEYTGTISQNQFFRPCKTIYSREEIKALGY